MEAQVGERQVHLAQGAAARHEGAGLQQLLQFLRWEGFAALPVAG